MPEVRADYSDQPWCPQPGCHYRCTPGTPHCWHHRHLNPKPDKPVLDSGLVTPATQGTLVTPQDPTSVGPDHIDWWRNPTTGQPTTNAIDWHATHTNDGQPHNPGCYICITNDSDHMARDPRPTTLPKDRPTTIDDVLRLRQPPPNAAGTCTADCKAEHDDGWTCIHGRSKSTARYDTATTATTPTDTVITAEHLTLHTAHITAGHPTNSACTVCQQMDTPPAAVTDATDDGLPVAAVPIEEIAEFQPSERAQAIRERLEAQRATGQLATPQHPAQDDPFGTGAPLGIHTPQPVGNLVDAAVQAAQERGERLGEALRRATEGEPEVRRLLVDALRYSGVPVAEAAAATVAGPEVTLDSPSGRWQRGARVRLRDDPHGSLGTVVERQLHLSKRSEGVGQVAEVMGLLVEWDDGAPLRTWHTPSDIEIV